MSQIDIIRFWYQQNHQIRIAFTHINAGIGIGKFYLKRIFQKTGYQFVAVSHFVDNVMFLLVE